MTASDDPQNTQVLLSLHDGGGQESLKIILRTRKGLWRDVASVPLEPCVLSNEHVLVGKMGYSLGDLEYIKRLAVAYAGISASRLRVGETATSHYSGAVAELSVELRCQVIALTRSTAKLEPLISLYPNITTLEFNSDVEADIAALKGTLPPAGADAFIDISPPKATVTPVDFNALCPYSRAVVLGAIGDIPLNYMTIMARNINIKG